MAGIDHTNPAVQKLFDLAKNLTNKGNNDHITIGEVRRALDTNADSFVKAGDTDFDNGLFNQMLTVPIDSITDTGLSASDIQKMRKAQDVLRIVKNHTDRILTPPQSLGTHSTDELIVNPYESVNDSVNDAWSSMRKSFAAQTVSINSDQAQNSVTNILKNNGNNMAGLVNTLWNNPDSVSGMSSKVIRMDELIGVFQHAQTTGNQEGFLNNFAAELGKSLNNPALGLDPQLVLDSLLQVIQSTDFNSMGAIGENFKGFMKNMVKGILENTNAFKGKTGVVGNYDGTRDGGVFGSLAVVKNANGTIEFIEHDPSDASLKTKYNLNGGIEAPGFGGDAGAGKANGDGAGFAPGRVDDAGARNNSEEVDSEKLQDELDKIQGKFDNPKGLLEKLKAAGDPDKLTAFNEKSEKLGVSIPQLISSKDINGLSDLIDALKTISNIADINGQLKLKDQINSLILKLENQLDKLKAEIAEGAPTGDSEEAALTDPDVLQTRLDELGGNLLDYVVSDDEDKQAAFNVALAKELPPDDFNIPAIIESKDKAAMNELIKMLENTKGVVTDYEVDGGMIEQVDGLIKGLQTHLKIFDDVRTAPPLAEESDDVPEDTGPVTEETASLERRGRGIDTTA